MHEKKEEGRDNLEGRLIAKKKVKGLRRRKKIAANPNGRAEKNAREKRGKREKSTFSSARGKKKKVALETLSHSEKLKERKKGKRVTKRGWVSKPIRNGRGRGKRKCFRKMEGSAGKAEE